MEKKDSLIFYISHYEAIKNSLSNEQLGRLFRLIFEKQLGNEVVLDKDIEIAFNFINNQLLVDAKKYEEISKKRSENGKKGGAPKGNKNAQKNNSNKQNKQNKLNDNENDNDNDNDNENVNDNVLPVVVEENKKEDLFSFYEKSFGRPISSAEYEIIETWEDNELTRYAVKQAELARAFNIRYIQSILSTYQKENIKTVAEAEERDKKFKENKEQRKTYKTPYERTKENLEKVRKELEAKGELRTSR